MGLKIPRSTTLAPPSPRLAVGTAQHRSFPRSLVHPPTSTPKPRAEGSSPSAPAKKERQAFACLSFFVSAHKNSATRHGCAPAQCVSWGERAPVALCREPTEAAAETSPMSIYACFLIRPHPLHLPPAPRTHPVSPFSG